MRALPGAPQPGEQKRMVGISWDYRRGQWGIEKTELNAYYVTPEEAEDLVIIVCDDDRITNNDW